MADYNRRSYNGSSYNGSSYNGSNNFNRKRRYRGAYLSSRGPASSLT